MLPAISNFLQAQFASAGSQAGFIAAFFRNTFRRGFEWNEFFHQCYLVGNKSLGLIGITGFILGFVMTLQSEPTMRDFGAESFVPSMVAISIIREIGPVIIALICAGKVASGMGAELASMKVSEQIDAMEVSGANPMQYLVVTRMLACIFMVPLLTLIGDSLALFGGFAASNINNNMTFTLYFTKAFAAVEFTDLVPAVIKTIFFGFAIGFAGCYKGFTANNGTESVGVAANSAVVMASLWVIVLDAIAVQLTSLIAYS
jgi:phospholipid/cholesterol/gamma-HCH transport system permease protein